MNPVFVAQQKIQTLDVI